MKLTSERSIALRVRTALSSVLLVATGAFLASCGGGGGYGGSSSTAPVVTAQPADASVVVPAAASFTAAGTGTPSPTVQWQQSTDGGTTWTAIAGATQSSYSTPATTTADNAKRFRAVFSNAAGSATSNGAVLTVSAPALNLSLLAGNIGGRGNFNGTGSGARFNNPTGIAVDAAGNVYVSELTNSDIRKITPAGAVSTLAGTVLVQGSNDGAGAVASFKQPSGLAVDSAGTVYVADTGNHLIRKVTAAGVVTTLAGSGIAGSADGLGAAASFNSPNSVTVDATGNVYVADTNNHTIRKITPAGLVSTLAGIANSPGYANSGAGFSLFAFPRAVAMAPSGNIHVLDAGNSAIRIVTPAGVVSALVVPGPDLGPAQGIAVDGAGVTYVAGYNEDTIKTISPAGVIARLAGTTFVVGITDGPEASALFNLPIGLAINAAGTLYVADQQNQTIRTISSGTVATLAGLASDFGGNDGTGGAARFDFPEGVVVDGAGNAYIADTNNQTVRKITPAGVVTTLAGTAGVSGSTDGLGRAASFDFPFGIAVDDAGVVYVAESANNTIRRITPAGLVSTLAGTAGVTGSADGTGAAASFSSPNGLAVDAAHNVYVADSGNSTIRKITPAGVVTTLAGFANALPGSTDGAGAVARFFDPQAIAIDASGTLYVADTLNHTIRKITPAGVVTTIAGAPSVIGSADGPGAAARFNFPQSVAVDAAGEVFVADTGNYTIRKISAVGVVSTVLGVTHEGIIRLGSDPRLYAPQALTSISGNSLVITTRGAVLLATIP
jgi:sugar lactone lactonase YvrE